jgi:hypothetical protein
MHFVDRANGLLKKVVRLFSTYALSNIEICEYQKNMPNKLFPSPVATNCLVVDHDDITKELSFPLASQDPASQSAFEKLHATDVNKWNQEDYLPNGEEVYMGRMSINNKVYAIWWRDDQEVYVAQEWKS